MSIHTEVLKEMNGLKPRIRHLLYVYPELRDSSSKEFVLCYWKEVYGWEEGDSMEKLALPESVARIKRLVVQEEPWLGPSIDVRRVKAERTEAIKEFVRAR